MRKKTEAGSNDGSEPFSLEDDNTKLLENFGAKPIKDVANTPDFYTFRNNLMVSHRDFDKYMSLIMSGEKSAIVSGFNASSSPHLAHLAVFDTNRMFQQKYGSEVFIPISDDESYVSGKIKSQAEGLKMSLIIARSMIALGFDIRKTKIIIDQLYTNIYNFAIQLSRSVTLSTVKASYGYSSDKNIGMHFYPAVQSAHILLPNHFGIRNVLVPIGPDEDPHIRICRDISELYGYRKPAVIHSRFLPGIDGKKMSKSKDNAIFLLEDEKVIRRKILNAFSGGQASIEEHRRIGGNPEVDVPFMYLKSYFLSPSESMEIEEEYKSGKLLSGEMKNMLIEKTLERLKPFQERYRKTGPEDMKKILLLNDHIDIEKILDESGIFT